MFRTGGQSGKPDDKLTHTAHIPENGRLSGIVYAALVSFEETVAEAGDAGAETFGGLRVL